MTPERGQTLVEFALVMPVLMVALLGFGEAAIAFATAHNWQSGADVLASSAAERIAEDPTGWRGGWETIARSEAAFRSCDDTTPDVAFPDGSGDAGSRVRVAWSCTYRPQLYRDFAGVLTFSGEAVVPYIAPAPSNEP